MRPRSLLRTVSDSRGFSLIELLVVILIIGILAAIAIPAFLGQRDRALDGAAKSAVRTADTAAETYFVGNDQSYSGLNRAELVKIEPTLADAPWSNNWCHEGGGQGVYGNGEVLCVAMQSKGPGRGQFELRRDPGYDPGVSRVCSRPGEGGCKEIGRGYGKW